MAKPDTDNKVVNITAAAPAPGAATTTKFDQPPRLGEMVTVRVADGQQLLNNETGLDFEPGADTLQTVTVNTLRRLAEGDLVRVA